MSTPPYFAPQGAPPAFAPPSFAPPTGAPPVRPPPGAPAFAQPSFAPSAPLGPPPGAAPLRPAGLTLPGAPPAVPPPGVVPRPPLQPPPGAPPQHAPRPPPGVPPPPFAPPSAHYPPPGAGAPRPPGPPPPGAAFSQHHAPHMQPPPPPGMLGPPPQQPPPPPGGFGFASGGGPPPGPAYSPGGGPYAPGPPGAYGADPSAPVEGLASLSLGTGGGGEGMDAASFPRPGPDDPPAPLPGSCSPAFMRLTTGALPASAALRARFGLPLAVLIHPLSPGAPEPPVANPGGAAIVRCRRCRTYINPFCVFIDGGRSANLNDVPSDYFCPVRPPMPPVFYLVFDVSAPALATGYLPIAAAAARAALAQQAAAAEAASSAAASTPPGGDPGNGGGGGGGGLGRALAGVLLFDSSLHFLAFRPASPCAALHSVAELGEPFLPCPPDELVVPLSECGALVDAALASLPATAASLAACPRGGGGCESALGPAVSAALAALQHVGGKLLLFSGQLPTLGTEGGGGRLRQRDDGRLWGTEKEHGLRNPEDGWFKKAAAELSRVQVCVDLWSLAAAYTDVAALATLPKFTGGQLYHMPGFSAAVPADAERLAFDVARNLGRPTAWEAVMRVRCSKGFRVAAFHGHFFVRSTDLLALPACDPDKGYAVQLAHEESVAQPGVTYLQCALLHTTSSGERRIRVHTLAAAVTEHLADCFRALDGGATAAMLAKLAVERASAGRLEEARASLGGKLAAALKEYRSLHPGAARAPNRLSYPEPGALLPLYALAAAKGAALRGGCRDVTTDVRAAAAFDVAALPVPRLLRLLYPTAHALHLWDGGGGGGGGGGGSSPPLAPLSAERIDAAGWYLFDDGQRLFLWAGRNAPPAVLFDLFAVPPQHLAAASAQQPGGLQLRRPAAGEQAAAGGGALGPAAAAWALVDRLRAACPESGLPLRCAVQGCAGEALLGPLLVEDRTQGGLSYAEQLLSLHRAVLAAPRPA